MRKNLLIANWKMNKSYEDLGVFVKGLDESGFLKQNKIDIAIAPSFPFLEKMGSLLKNTSVRLGAQNAHWETKGAFTGEVSFSMLKEFGVEYVILGHSERRQYFKESDQDVAKKAKACIENKLKAVVCVGESLEERKNKQTISVIERQVNAVIAELPSCEHLVIAYEPVWAIGTGISATVSQAQEVHFWIRTLLAKKFYKEGSDSVRILYGGSMNAANCKDLIQEEDIDGGLVGGASLEAKSFSEMLKNLG